MAGLKAWSGSAFVDGQPRIWNGTTFVAPSACHIWDGSKFVKVWPSFSRQRMNKTTATEHRSAKTTNPVPGFVSDSTYPATVTGGTTLVIAGSGPVTVTARVTGQLELAGVSSATATLYRNGASLGTATITSTTAQTVPITWSGTVAEGDTLTLGWTTNTFYASTMLAGTYIEVEPTY